MITSCPLAPPPAPPAEGESVALREALARAGYEAKAVIERLGAIETPSRRAGNLQRLLRATSSGDPLDTLIRLFLFGLPVGRTPALEPWRRAGLVASRDDALVARVKLTPFADAIHASDFAQTGAEDVVPGVTGASQALLHFTVRHPCCKALDLGSGCGIQAFAAARHGDRVVAIDSNPRSVAFTRFGAALNGLANVECRQGDALAPFGGERFDLIVSNSPFLISPSRRYQYRDSGLAGDEFCRRLIRQAPDLLEEGGFFQICLDWVHYRGMDWKERLAGWFEGSGCDVWVLRNQTEDPAAYAERWIRDTEAEDADPRAELAGQWLDYYESLGIEAFSTGWIAMRRRAARSNWLRFDEAPERTIEPFGEVVATVFTLNDFLQDGDLLEQRLRLAPEVRLDHRSRWEEGRWIPVSTEIALARGLLFRAEVDFLVVAVLARLDGGRTLGEVFAEIAGALGKPSEEIAGECLDVLRGLVGQGFLLPAH